MLSISEILLVVLELVSSHLHRVLLPTSLLRGSVCFDQKIFLFDWKVFSAGFGFGEAHLMFCGRAWGRIAPGWFHASQ